MADIGELSLTATIDTRNYESGASKITSANSRIKSGMSGVASSSDSASSIGSKGAAKLSAAWGVVAGIASSLVTKAFDMITDSIGSAVSRVDTMNNFPKIMKNLGYSSDDAAKSIKKMSDNLDGLPTSLDSMTNMVTQLAPLTDGLDDATDIALAFNNALLAGGKSMDLQNNAMEQYNQMLAAGKVDRQAWRSMQTAMPGQLNQVAKALLGTTKNSNDLYEAMKDGTVSFDDFNNAVKKLNKEGMNGFASFEQQAKDATKGIATSFTNLKTRVTKAMGTIIDAIGSDTITKPVDAFSSGFAKAADKIARKISFIKTAIANIKPALKDLLDTGDITGAFERMTKVMTFGDSFRKMFQNIKDGYDDMVSQIKTAGDNIRSFTSRMFDPDKVGKQVDDMKNKVIQGFGNIVKTVEEKVGDIVGWIGTFIGALDPQPIKDFFKAVGNLFGAIGDMAGAIGGVISSLFNAGSNAEDSGKKFDTARKAADLFNGVMKTLGDAIQVVADTLKNVADWIKTFTDRLNDNGALKTWADTVGTMFDAVKKLFGALGNLISKFTPMKKATDDSADSMDSASDSADAFTGFINVMSSVINGIASVFDGISTAIDTFSGWLDTVNDKIPGFTTAIGGMGSAVTDPFSPIIVGWNAVQALADNDVWNGFVEAVKKPFQDLATWFQNLWDLIKGVFTGAFDNIGSTSSTGATNTATGITTPWSGMAGTIGNIWNGISGFIGNIWGTITGQSSNGANNTSGTVTSGFSSMSGAASNIWNAMSGSIGGFISGIAGNIGGVLGGISGTWSGAWNGMKGMLSNAWSGMASGAQSGVRNIGSIAGSIKGTIMSAVSGAGSWLVNAGSQIMNGLISGLKGAFGNVMSTISSMASSIASAAKSALKIGSPSKVFRDQVGRWIPAGISVGIDKNMPDLIGDVQKQMSLLTKSYTPQRTISDWDTASQSNTGIVPTVPKQLPSVSNTSSTKVSAPITVQTNDPDASARETVRQLNWQYV